MPQFTRQSSRPLSPRSYRAAVRRVRQLCDAIADNAEAQSPTERAGLTRAINGLAGAAGSLARRHRGVSVAHDLADPFADAPLTGPGSRLHAQLSEIHGQGK